MTATDQFEGDDSWFSEDGDRLFAELLRVGDVHCRRVAERIARESGSQVHVPTSRVRSSRADRHRFAQEVDIIIGQGDATRMVEVKSRNLPFTDDPTSYPYETAFVDTRDGWDQKIVKPCAVVLASQRPGGGMLVISVRRTRRLWVPRISGDRVRGFRQERYEVPRTALRPLSDLTTWLGSLSPGR